MEGPPAAKLMRHLEEMVHYDGGRDDEFLGDDELRKQIRKLRAGNVARHTRRRQDRRGVVMAYEFRFPDIGEGITEGEILAWKVKEGDTVAEDQTLAEVETDKAVVELPSPRAGRVTGLQAAEGDIINVGDVVVTIEEARRPRRAPRRRAGATPSAGGAWRQPRRPLRRYRPAAPVAAAQAEPGRPAEPYTGSVVGSLEEAPEEEPRACTGCAGRARRGASAGPAEPGPGVLALPSVRALAKELGRRSQHHPRHRAGGRILKQDVEDVAQLGAYGGWTAAVSAGAPARRGGSSGGRPRRAAPAGPGVAGDRPAGPILEGTVEESDLGLWSGSPSAVSAGPWPGAWPNRSPSRPR